MLARQCSVSRVYGTMQIVNQLLLPIDSLTPFPPLLSPLLYFQPNYQPQPRKWYTASLHRERNEGNLIAG